MNKYGLDDNIRKIKGIGDKTAGLFEKLGVHTVFELLTYYPRSYEDRTNIKDISALQSGETAGINARLAAPVETVRTRTSLRIYKMRFADDTGSIDVTCFNQSYLAGSLKTGEEYFIFGKAERKFGRLEMTSPAIEKAGAVKNRGILPVYRLSAGLTNSMLRKYMLEALGSIDMLSETLPREIVEKNSLMSFDEAVRAIHFPEGYAEINKARERLIFEELFILQSGIMLMKNKKDNYADEESKLNLNVCSLRRFIECLSYKLTDAQQRVIDECINDICSGKIMQRLVQGDVGSGKTAVAAAVAFAVMEAGGQTALMAPTEILASQHYKTLEPMFSRAGFNCALLTGATGKKEKDAIKKALAEGEINFVVGTHALITGDVEFKSLKLVIADEQHRFGVVQRARLYGKGRKPHVIVMSATPIPRTLGLVIYGDMDISVIDEMPPGRKPVKTVYVKSSRRDEAYRFAVGEIKKGRQAYIVCPMVEEEDAGAKGLHSVNELYEELSSGQLAGCRLACIHGKMSGKQKEELMTAFASGQIDALVSTTVIEVGINVPNATLIYIENAERFGLSQLHQLRGRVGRGDEGSCCVLISGSDSEKAKNRLKLMCETNDGFKISEYDLKERGPGDFFGDKQHGLPDLKIADLLLDVKILQMAADAAKAVFNREIILSAEEKKMMRRAVGKLFSQYTI